MKHLLITLILLFSSLDIKESIQKEVLYDDAIIKVFHEKLNVLTTLTNGKDTWAKKHLDSLKIGVNEFYYVLQNGMSVEFKIIRYE